MIRHRPSPSWLFRLPRNDAAKLFVVLLWWPFAIVLWLIWFVAIGWWWFIVREHYAVEADPVRVIITRHDD